MHTPSRIEVIFDWFSLVQFDVFDLINSTWWSITCTCLAYKLLLDERLYSSVSTLPYPPRACSMCTMTGKLFPVLYSTPSDYSPCSILIPRLLVLFSLDVLHTLWIPHFYAEIQFIKRAYGKAGNGNEMKTRNRNWKWKLETELETKTAPIMGEVSSRTYE